MKVLYFVRLFSGLEKGLMEGQWAPHGVPTITHMIEALDRGDDEVKLVFACKDYGNAWTQDKDMTFTVDGLHSDVTVLAGERVFPKWLGRLRSRLSLVRQMYRLWQMKHAFNPDVIYIDRGNMWAAAWFSRLTSLPVVWRVMGVLPTMRMALGEEGWRAVLARWAYRSPFAAVVCTLDGSGGGPWMDKALKSDVPRHLLLNGMDWDKVGQIESGDMPALKGKTVILFVGRLEDNKGCEGFLEAFTRATHQVNGEMHAVVIGDGSLRQALEHQVADAGLANNVTFTGSVTPATVLNWQRRADIYVSLNNMGNLSNANLEALACGACIVLPSAQPEEGIDIDTNNIVPDDTALRFGPIGDMAKLADTLVHLHTARGERVARARKTADLARTLIPGWQERVTQELNILRTVAQAQTS